jgi:hypothetical protein
MYYACLGCVVRAVPARYDSVHRGYVDDLAFRRLLSEHLLRLGLRTQKYAGEIHLHDPLPLTQRQTLASSRWYAESGVIYGDVQSAEALGDRRNGLVNLLSI